MNGDQLRMARALLRLTVRELAQASGVDKMAIVRFEAGRNPHAATLAKLQAALEERGIVFIGAVTTFHEPTVAMRFGMKPPAAHDGDDEVADNGEVDPSLSLRRIAAMRDYWSVGARWFTLRAASRNILLREMILARSPNHKQV
jgi:transcriptional regulator with XRE-family HTH domain